MLLGIDASSKSTGWSVFEGKELTKYGCIKSSSTDLFKRIHVMVDGIENIIKEYEIDTIVMEEVIPDHTKNTQTFKALMYLQATVMMMLHDKFPKVKIELIYPGTWRATCGIKNGRGTVRATLKEADIQFVKSTYSIIPENDDIADAICIGHAHLYPKKVIDHGAF